MPIFNVLEKKQPYSNWDYHNTFYSSTNLVKKGLISTYSESENNVIKISNLLLWNDIYSLRLISRVRYFGIITRLIENWVEK